MRPTGKLTKNAAVYKTASLSFILRVKKFILKESLIRPGDRLIVAVSGGADSVALLETLCVLRNEWGLELIVAHFNHNIRSSSKGDQDFVRRLARARGLIFITEDWKSLKKRHVSEDESRNKRFDFLVRTAAKYKVSAVALAHTLDDVAETVLMRILRGSGLQGLRGILPKRTIRKQLFIRPLLETKKDDIERFLKSLKTSFKTDQTNAQDIYFRNKVRLKLIPLLEKEYSPNIKELLVNLAQTVAADYSHLEEEGLDNFLKDGKIAKDGAVLFSLEKFLSYPQAIKRMLLRQSVYHLKGDTNVLTFTHMKEAEALLEGASYKEVHWPNGLVVRKEPSLLKIMKKR